ncbi:hypothetical protein D3C78_525180 [compost metagenome]
MGDATNELMFRYFDVEIMTRFVYKNTKNMFHLLAVLLSVMLTRKDLIESHKIIITQMQIDFYRFKCALKHFGCILNYGFLTNE